jgi:hypothetical protein
MDLSKLDPGPYADAEAARAMLQLDVLDPDLAVDEHHLRTRAEVVIDRALIHGGVDDLTDYEVATRRQIARTVADPEQAQVIAGWIRRAYQAGHLASITRSGPVTLDGDR